MGRRLELDGSVKVRSSWDDRSESHISLVLRMPKLPKYFKCPSHTSQSTKLEKKKIKSKLHSENSCFEQ